MILRNTEPNIGEFTIEDMLNFFEKNRKYYTEGNQLSFMNDLIGNKTDSDKLYIQKLRNFIRFYRGMDEEKHGIQPSILRLYGQPKLYSLSKESIYSKNILEYPFMNEKSSSTISINLLARMQHYNYKSRLIDITLNLAVAIYMASYSSYLKTGKLMSFVQKSYKNKDDYYSKSNYDNVLNSYHYNLWPSNNVKKNLSAMNFLSNATNKYLNPSKNYISEPVVIIDRTTFVNNTKAYDLRYDAQEGAFIMVLNKYNSMEKCDLGNLDVSYLSNKKIRYQRLLYKNKFAFLYLLASNGITNVTIYPDKELSHEVIKLNNKLKPLNNQKSKLSCLVNCIDDYKKYNIKMSLLSNADFVNVCDLCNHYYNKSSIMEFLLTDYIEILFFRKKLYDKYFLNGTKEENDANLLLSKLGRISEIDKFNDGVQVLIKVSKQNLFKYLYI